MKAERYSVAKRQTRYTYTEGPMTFLAQQIVKEMQMMGYPTVVTETWRTQRKQWSMVVPAFASPHQYGEAAHLEHADQGTSVSQEYWQALKIAVDKIADKYAIELVTSLEWSDNPRHVEIEDWDSWAQSLGFREPTDQEKRQRFEDKLPAVWKQYKTSVSYQKNAR